MLDRVYQVKNHLNSNMAESKTPDITLYTAATPNGIKISILLEELGYLLSIEDDVIRSELTLDSLPYKTVKIDMSKNTQKEPWFEEINPNGRIPALTDTFSDGNSIRLFESGSIMQYLIEQYDTKHLLSYPSGSRETYEVNNWLFFLNAGVGPMQVSIVAFYGFNNIDDNATYRASQTTFSVMLQRRLSTGSIDIATKLKGYTVCWISTLPLPSQDTLSVIDVLLPT